MRIMRYKAIYFKKEVEFITNICIGDIVTVNSYGGVYLYYTQAYYNIWGLKGKSIANKGLPYAEIQNILSNSKAWRVVGFIAHSKSEHGILVGLQDRSFNKIIMNLRNIKLLRKKIKDTHKTVIVNVL